LAPKNIKTVSYFLLLALNLAKACPEVCPILLKLSTFQPYLLASIFCHPALDKDKLSPTTATAFFRPLLYANKKPHR
jgi:hypothetical protein